MCGDYSFTSPSRSRDGQIKLRRLPKLQLENSILHFFFFFFIKGVLLKYTQAIFSIKSMGCLGQEVGNNLLPYIYIYMYIHIHSHTGVVNWLKRSK